jgi:hypothetical protein
MHSLSASFVLGYHGCDRETGEKLLRNEAFRPSENDFDWLGSGIYFWEANPDRAMQWAVERASRKRVLKGAELEPFVVGAVIDPGFCLDLITSNGVREIERAYVYLHAVSQASGAEIPANSGGDDMLLRKLDCAVINLLHRMREEAGEEAFDSVRGMFTEGEHVYENSGFRRKSHIQICVRNPDSIKGVFRVPERHFTKPSETSAPPGHRPRA